MPKQAVDGPRGAAVWGGRPVRGDRLWAALRPWLMLAPLLPAGALAQGASSPPGVPVVVSTAATQDVPVILHTIGTVQALQSVLVRARVDGTLDSVGFTEGQDVKAGDLLAQIDPRPYKAALDQAQAKKAADLALLANAKLDLARYSSLARSQFATVQSVDTQNALVQQYQANVQADDAAIETAALNLTFTHITAPFDGRVGLRLVDPGNLIHATDTAGIVTLAQIHPISAVFTLPQDDLPELQAAMARGPVKVAAYSGDDRTALSQGSLLAASNSIDQTTGTIALKANFPNADDHLWPGQFINLHVTLKILPQAVTVPSPAVLRGPTGMYVYAVKPDSTVALTPVAVALDDGHVAVIGSGLASGQTVVVNGQSKLQTGSRVAATPAPAAAPAS
jgi:multidrug efflux system membrane fusion protein